MNDNNPRDRVRYALAAVAPWTPRELIPCPFCRASGDALGIIDHHSNRLPAHAVGCTRCYATGPIRSTPGEAAVAWNRQIKTV